MSQDLSDLAVKKQQGHTELVVGCELDVLVGLNVTVLLAKVTSCPSSQPVIMYCRKLYITPRYTTAE
jgi:hypothetical protein